MWGKKVQAGTFYRVNELEQKIAQKIRPNFKKKLLLASYLRHHYLILLSYMYCASCHLSSPILFLPSTPLQLSS